MAEPTSCLTPFLAKAGVAGVSEWARDVVTVRAIPWTEWQFRFVDKPAPVEALARGNGTFQLAWWPNTSYEGHGAPQAALGYWADRLNPNDL